MLGQLMFFILQLLTIILLGGNHLFKVGYYWDSVVPSYIYYPTKIKRWTWQFLKNNRQLLSRCQYTWKCWWVDVDGIKQCDLQNLK